MNETLPVQVPHAYDIQHNECLKKKDMCASNAVNPLPRTARSLKGNSTRAGTWVKESEIFRKY